MARFLWTQKQDIGPAPRMLHAATYDAGRKRTVLFGGSMFDAALRDTWEWDGSFWVQVADTGPSGRYLHAMCFDPARGEALLFGGYSGSNLGDSWSWNGADWTQVEDQGPSPRWGHAMTFDPVRGRAVLFGGGPGPLRDTWEWDGEGWTQVEDTGPGARLYAMLEFDRATGRTILFGGQDNSTRFADTWAWDGTRWTQIADTGPRACALGAMAATEARLILFGGNSQPFTSTATLYDDSWTLEGERWTQRQDMGPAARWGHTLVYDEARRTAVLFGGQSTAQYQKPGLLGDTWEYVETAPAPGGGGGGGIEVEGLLAVFTLDPSAAAPGQDILAQVELRRSGQVVVPITIWVVRRETYDAENGNLDVIPPQEFTRATDFTIAPGQMSGSKSFQLPNLRGEYVAIAVAGQEMLLANLMLL